MSKYKQGTVSAVRQLKDKRWAIRFDRKNPKEGKSKSWYVYLLLGIVPPNVGDQWGAYTDKLQRINDLGGCDCYEQMAEQTKSTTRILDNEGNDMPDIEIKTLEEHATDAMSEVGFIMFISAALCISKHPEYRDRTIGSIAEELRSVSEKLIKSIREEYELTASRIVEILKGNDTYKKQ